MEFYTVEEVAKTLKTTNDTIRKYIRCGQLSAYKVGKAWRVEEKDLQNFLVTCKASPGSSLEPGRGQKEPDLPFERQLHIETPETETLETKALETLGPTTPIEPAYRDGIEEGIIAVRSIPIKPIRCHKCGQTLNFQGPCPRCTEPYEKIIQNRGSK